MERQPQQGRWFSFGFVLIFISLLGGCAHHKWGFLNKHGSSCPPQRHAVPQYPVDQGTSTGGSVNAGDAYQGTPVQPSFPRSQPGSGSHMGSGSY
jgi:hypothetical protein